MNLFPPALRPAGRLALFCSLAGLALPAQGQPAASPVSRTISWSTGQATAIVPMSRAQLAARIDQLAARREQRHVLVSFSQPLTAQDRARLERDGLTITTALGGTSYFANLSLGADHNALSGAALASIAPIAQSQKLHRDIQNGVFRPWMINQESLRKSPAALALTRAGLITADELSRLGLDPQVVVIVSLHADADRQQAIKDLTARHSARLVREIRSLNAMTLALPASEAKALGDDDRVMWVEPPIPALEESNAENRALTGVNTVNDAPYALSGDGVTVMVYDGGQVFDHEDLHSRLTIGVSDTDSVSYHATHVAGTIGGDGAGNINNRGMAPGVELVSYGFQVPGGLGPGFLYTDPGDLEDDYDEALSLYSVDITNNSIGSNIESNGYDCAWQGDYGATSALIDAIARGALGAPHRIIWAASNERQGDRCDVEGFGDFYSIAPPAGAKNHISVGSVDADTDNTSSFSGWGPTDDGRLKPDISAPGCQSNGDRGVTSTNSGGGYINLCGTSMAAPTATGVAALILEQYRQSFPERSDPMNATLKALLANTAIDRGNPGPDFKYGYGSIRATSAIDTVIAQNIAELQVAQGQTTGVVVIVEPATPELKLTIAWDDAPAAPNVSSALVNDLDLRVFDPDGHLYLPWTLDPAAPSAHAVQAQPDHRNNIEQVAIANPAPGAYTIEIEGFNIAQGDAQSFAVVSSSTLINCDSKGEVRFGQGALPCAGTSTVRVVDCDLNTSNDITDTADVMLASTTPGANPLMLTLTETAPESATFIASFSFDDTGGADLLVSDLATLTATYIDADDGAGGANVMVTASAQIDCAPADLQSLSFTNIQPRSAVVELGFDEPASAVLRYGLSPSTMNQTTEPTRLADTHRVLITDLQDGATYYFAAQATDVAGNTSDFDNAGAGYPLATPDIPDFFTELFTNGLDLQGYSLVLTPSDDADGYTANLAPLDAGLLPFEPTQGAALSLVSNEDDESQFVALTGGASVWLFGQPYSGVYACTNGHLTFGQEDSAITESHTVHFALPRISALFDDLRPEVAGTMYSQQLDDRLVISWDRVTEYSPTNVNTFQVELHFDGVIVISWERIDLDDALVGVSRGQGVSPEFIDSDISAYPAPIAACPADLNDDGSLNFFDVSAFLTAFNNQDPAADFTNDGQYNFFDISAFLGAFSAGCP